MDGLAFTSLEHTARLSRQPHIPFPEREKILPKIQKNGRDRRHMQHNIIEQIFLAELSKPMLRQD